MTKRIQNAIDIFLDAINEGTLAKGHCEACAVGNLAAAAVGDTIVREKGAGKHTNFRSMFSGAWMTGVHDMVSWFVQENEGTILEQTAFSLRELYEIERAFEHNTKINGMDYTQYSEDDIREDQINGLEAVIKVMLTFEEQTDDVKEVFTAKADKIPIRVHCTQE